MKHFNLIFILFFIISVFVSGCRPITIKATNIDSTGYFSTENMITKDEIIVQKPFKEKYRKVLYLNTNPSQVNVHRFFMDSFRNMGFFDVVMGWLEMEQLVIEKGLSEKVKDVYSNISLYKLQKDIGPFLIVEPTVAVEPTTSWGNSYNFKYSLEAIDPENNETVFHVTFNYTRIPSKMIDKKFFHPLLNAFIDWIHDQPVQTAQKHAR